MPRAGGDCSRRTPKTRPAKADGPGAGGTGWLEMDGDRDIVSVETAGGTRPAARAVPGEEHLPFVMTIAREYRHLGIPLEDLVAEGYVGILEAARRFDPERGNKFPTYAAWWIRKTILVAISERSRLVRIPHQQWKRAQRVHDAERALAGRLGRTPDRDEVSRYLGSSIAEIDRMLLLQSREVRLDARARDDDATRLVDRLADRSSPDPEVRLLRREARRIVLEELGQLSLRERWVLAQRFGLDGRPSRSLEEIGNRLGVSRERIRQIESRAIGRLRRRVKLPSRGSAESFGS